MYVRMYISNYNDRNLCMDLKTFNTYIANTCVIEFSIIRMYVRTYIAGFCIGLCTEL